MQELRSTEILDKEIHEDAQKKVLKIRQNSEAECSAILASVDEKINQALKEKDDFFAKKLEIAEKNQNASIPLEKERFEVSFVQNVILQNINDYLSKLTQEKRVELVTKSLDEVKEIIDQKKFYAFVYGFDTKVAEKILTEKLGKNVIKCQPTEFGKIVLEDENIDLKEGIILDAEDKSIRLRLTLSEVIKRLLDKNRIELSNALFGN